MGKNKTNKKQEIIFKYSVPFYSKVQIVIMKFTEYNS